MKKYLFVIGLMLVGYIGSYGQLTKKEMKLPDIPGYETLKCDFHIHTVFSDGDLWPTLRVDEAWMLGYDAIAITDHIEYQPHKDYIPVQHNAAYEIALPKGEMQDLIVIHGSEITRQMPPGHLNAIFIEDATAIETSLIRHKHATQTPSNYMDSIDHVLKDYLTALEAAYEQGGFIFWNHPGWTSQAPEGIQLFDIHKELIQKGWLKGIEVANSGEWYPEAFQWCLDYDLAMLSNSDIHSSEEIFETTAKVEHRPVTLVFAESRTGEGIREALESARTAVWFNNMVLGRAAQLEPLFLNSIKLSDAFYRDQRGRTYHNLSNISDFTLKLLDLDSKTQMELPPQSTLVIQFDEVRNSRRMSVENFLVAPDKALEITLMAP